MNRTCILHRTAALWVVGVWGWLALPALAQSNPEAELQELRRRVQHLEQQLQSTRSVTNFQAKVTQIGSRPLAYEPQQVVRVYDVGDLFVVAPVYEAQRESDLRPIAGPLFPETKVAARRTGITGGLGGGFGGGGGAFNIKNPQQKAKPNGHALHQMNVGYGGGGAANGIDIRPDMDALIEAITRTIQPESWEDVGGPNTIEELGNLLIVSATEDVHALVEDLLGLLRKRWGALRTVSLKAYWVWLTEDELAELLAAELGAQEAKQGPKPVQGTIQREAWQRLLQKLAQDGERPAGYRAALTCYNGQTVHVVCGAQSLAITGMKALVGSGGVAYEPDPVVIQEGTALQVTPAATSSGKYVVLDVHSRVSRLKKTARSASESAGQRSPLPKPKGTSSSVATTHPPAVDRPRLINHRLATTLRMPVDQLVLIGGMTVENESAPGEPSLYLIIEASVQELQDESHQGELTETDQSAAQQEAEPRE